MCGIQRNGDIPIGVRERPTMTRLRAAIAFLTQVPMHRTFTAADVGRATLFFPLVGAAIGGVQAGLLKLTSGMLPPLLLSLCLIVATLWLTGLLHLDGLADMADGFGGGHSREETLRIMQDPAVGSFGAIALVLLLATKAVAISVLIERDSATRYLVLAPTLSRWTMVALGRSLPYARLDGGLGSAVSEHSGRMEFIVATVVAMGITGAVGGSTAITCWVAAALVTAGVGRTCYRRLGGFTGDTLGANAELTEVAVLLCAVWATR